MPSLCYVGVQYLKVTQYTPTATLTETKLVPVDRSLR